MPLPWIPELVCQIAIQLEDVVDISRLSRCDRFINGAVAPILFRDIAIPARCLPNLAQTFCDNPEAAQMCRSFTIYSSQLGSDRRIEQPDLLDQGESSTHSPEVLSRSIILIMREICRNDRLERFTCFESRFCGPQYPLDAEFWAALSRLSRSLKVLSLAVVSSEREGFVRSYKALTSFLSLNRICS
jgi:hypothetical protein